MKTLKYLLLFIPICIVVFLLNSVIHYTVMPFFIKDILYSSLFFCLIIAILYIIWKVGENEKQTQMKRMERGKK